MNTCLAQSATPGVRYQPYGALSPASDYVIRDEPPVEQEPEGDGCTCRELEPLRRLHGAGISLDAAASLSCIRLGEWGHRFLSMAMFVPFASPATGVTAEGPEDTWLASAFDELEELSKLPEDWDYEGSPAISDELVLCVADTLCSLKTQSSRMYPVPAIVPVPGGKVQLEWRKADMYFEIEFLGGDLARYLYKKGINVRTGRINVSQVSTLARIVERMFA